MTSLNARAVVDAAANHLPTALSGKWLSETWAGTYGRAGLRADMRSISSSVNLANGALSGRGAASGVVLTPDGDEVGTVTRNVSLMRSGRLNVYHAYLKLDSEVHGSGFASAFNNHAFEEYAKAGVDDATVTAALSAGGYVWARTGFELAPKTWSASAEQQALDGATKLRSLIVSAHRSNRITSEQFAKLEPRLLRSDDVLRPDTLTSVRELAAMDGIGEGVLKGQSWSGIRPIEPAQRWWQTTQAARAGLGTGGAGDAATGAMHLRDPDVELPAMAEARRALTASVPDVLNPDALGQMLQDGVRHRRVRLVAGEQATLGVNLIKPEVTTSRAMHVLNGRGREIGQAAITTSLGENGALTGRSVLLNIDDHDRRALTREVVDDALRGLGATVQ